MDDTSNNIRQRLRPRRNTSTTAAAVIKEPGNNVAIDHETGTDCKSDTHVATTAVTTETTIDIVDATPPFHTILVYGVMVVVLLYYLPTFEQIDEIATIQVITQCQYFSFISIYHIAIIRCMCTVFISIVVVQMIFNKKGWYITTPYLKESKLMKHVQHHMIGIKTLYPFTSWSFVLLGLYFALASYVTIQAIWIQQKIHTSTTTLEDAYHSYNITHRNVLRFTIVVWEISAPCTILIAITVRYAMWPAALRRIREELALLETTKQQQQPTTTKSKSHPITDSTSTTTPPQRPSHSLNSYQNMWMPNINVLLALVERCILTGIPVRYNEWTLAPLYGCIYVLFTWNMIYQYNDRKRYGPHFIYFFLDTTLPGYFCSYALIALLLVLLAFYSLYCGIESILHYIDHTIVDPFLTIATDNHSNNHHDSNEYCYLVAHVSVVLLICSFVMRFRD